MPAGDLQTNVEEKLRDLVHKSSFRSVARGAAKVLIEEAEGFNEPQKQIRFWIGRVRAELKCHNRTLGGYEKSDERYQQKLAAAKDKRDAEKARIKEIMNQIATPDPTDEDANSASGEESTDVESMSVDEDEAQGTEESCSSTMNVEGGGCALERHNLENDGASSTADAKTAQGCDFLKKLLTAKAHEKDARSIFSSDDAATATQYLLKNFPVIVAKQSMLQTPTLLAQQSSTLQVFATDASNEETSSVPQTVRYPK